MKRFASAAVLVAALGSSADAQPSPTQPSPTTPRLSPPVAVQPGVIAPPVGAPAPNVFVPPGTPPGPAIPFYKSGGVVVGVYGFYPYDTGHWLLGGTEGTTRQSGAFTMVFPVYPEATGEFAPVSRGSIFHGKHHSSRPGLLRR